MILNCPVHKNKVTTLFFIFFIFTSYAQNKKETRIDKDFPTPVAFPYEYLGSYAGNMNISDITGTLANIPTEFEISKTDNDKVFNYRFEHIQGKERVIKNYELHVIDESKGFYVIKDENDFEYMATLIKGALYSSYDTSTAISLTVLEFYNDGKMRFNTTLAKKAKKKIKSSEVQLSNVVQVQKALLSKVN